MKSSRRQFIKESSAYLILAATKSIYPADFFETNVTLDEYVNLLREEAVKGKGKGLRVHWYDNIDMLTDGLVRALSLERIFTVRIGGALEDSTEYELSVGKYLDNKRFVGNSRLIKVYAAEFKKDNKKINSIGNSIGIEGVEFKAGEKNYKKTKRIINSKIKLAKKDIKKKSPSLYELTFNTHILSDERTEQNNIIQRYK